MYNQDCQKMASIFSTSAEEIVEKKAGLLDMPVEIMHQIFNYLPYDTVEQNIKPVGAFFSSIFEPLSVWNKWM